MNRPNFVLIMADDVPGFLPDIPEVLLADVMNSLADTIGKRADE